MIIIFEGPDNSGKTHIALELSKRTLIPYFKHKKVEDTAQFTKNVDLFLSEFAQIVPFSVIFDRHIATEYVYGQVFNRLVPFDEIYQIDENYSKLDTYIILCVKRVYKNYHDEHTPKSKLKEIIRQYNSFLKWTKCKVLVLDTTDENLEKQIKTILNFIEREQNEFNKRVS